MNLTQFRFIVVGAGFFGATIAERIATIKQEKVLVVEKRDHIGGNCYSYRDKDTDIEVHRYGSHIFHTSSQEVWNYLNRFTQFNTYQHRVFASAHDELYSLPINLHTICQYFHKTFTPGEAKQLIIEKAFQIEHPANLEEKAISLIGHELYELLIKGYTKKQWNQDPNNLPASIIERLPVRYNFNTNYFDDIWQGLPLHGYDYLFKQMLGNPRIQTALNKDFEEIGHAISSSQYVIFTGPIDTFYQKRYGSLSWRSLQFEFETIEVKDFQGNAVINYPDITIPYTRIHEFKHYHPERSYNTNKTIICREYSIDNTASNDPMYPVNSEQDQELYKRYEKLASQEKNIFFGGRLGRYRYYDMDDAILAALNLFNNELRNI